MDPEVGGSSPPNCTNVLPHPRIASRRSGKAAHSGRNVGIRPSPFAARFARTGDIREGISRGLRGVEYLARNLAPLCVRASNRFIASDCPRNASRDNLGNPFRVSVSPSGVAAKTATFAEAVRFAPIHSLATKIQAKDARNVAIQWRGDARLRTSARRCGNSNRAK